MKIDIVLFDATLATSIAGLAQRAFAEISEGAQPTLSAQLVENLLGASNPAGASHVALAREGDDVLGSFAAVPARFRRGDGQAVMGWQIGFFFVDRRAQGKGIGTSLLAELTAAFHDRTDAFLYAFPNVRSKGILISFGYERVASIPTYIYPPTPYDICLRMRPPKTLKERGPCAWEPVFVDAAEAQRYAHEFFAANAPQVGIIRDAVFFVWRYCGVDADQRYRFLLCRTGDERSTFLLVLAKHQFSRVPFTILVDALSTDLFRAYYPAVKAARLMGGSPFVYANTNLGRLAAKHGITLPFGVPIPRAVNPRPVELLRFPSDTVLSREDLANCPILTGDWMGF